MTTLTRFIYEKLNNGPVGRGVSEDIFSVDGDLDDKISIAASPVRTSEVKK